MVCKLCGRDPESSEVRFCRPVSDQGRSMSRSVPLRETRVSPGALRDIQSGQEFSLLSRRTPSSNFSCLSLSGPGRMPRDRCLGLDAVFHTQREESLIEARPQGREMHWGLSARLAEGLGEEDEIQGHRAPVRPLMLHTSA